MDHNLLVLAADVIEEENLELELMFNLANVAALVILEMEDGISPTTEWVKITVNMEEYRLLGDPCFEMHFRMNTSTFEKLAEVMFNYLKSKSRWRRTVTPVAHILLMVIWLLATPDSFRSVALRFGVNPSSLYFHYQYIIEALREIAPRYIQWPNENEQTGSTEEFQGASGFPGIVGCIDCTHVYVTKPLENSQDYVNRHHTYSLTTQVVVDHQLLVRDLYVGEPGSLHDNRTLNKSPLYRKLLEDGAYTLLRPGEHIIGDGAYAQHNFLLTPFTDDGHQTELQIKHNKKFCMCRSRVEHAFGLCKGKWRRLKGLHAMNQRIVVDHVTACFVLHNFIILDGEPLFLQEEPAQLVIIEDAVNVGDDGGEPLGNQHHLVEDSQRRGEEKRQFILDHIISNLD